MRRVHKTCGLFVIIGLIIILSSACMGTPERDDQRYADEPILWLYNHTTDGDLPSLYRQVPGEEPLKIADRAVPGSHRAHGGNVLFLDDHGVLYYAQPEQEPHRVFEDVRPFNYGFFDGELKVFAVSDHGELWLKSFGSDAQLLAEEVEQVIRLSKHLIVRSGGTVRSYDRYGEEHTVTDKADSMQISSDGRHALISMEDGTAITDGMKLIHTIASPFNQLGFVQVAGNGSKIVFLDGYDSETGTGRLMAQELDMPAVTLADKVGSVIWDEDRDQVWYTTAGTLKLAKLKASEVFDIADQVLSFSLSGVDGSIAAAIRDGMLMTIDAAGDPLLTQPAEGIRRVDHFGSGILYTTEDGQKVIADAEEVVLLGQFDQWLYDNRYIVYVHDDRISAIDRTWSERVLLDDRRAYRYVYYGERLLAETLLRISDLAGAWHAADERTLEIRSSGRQKGTIRLGNSEARPFYVTYAAYDHLKLMVIGELDHPIYVKLRADGSLELDDGEELTVYVKSR